jgi:hypothetical protein
MRRTFFLVVALVLLPASAQAKDSLEYLDLLTAEAVGELGTQTYDERIAKNFVGTRELAGVLVGGGIGIRPVWRFPSGVRFSIEASGVWGRLRDADRNFSYSTVTRAEFLTGIGYELHLGKSVALHSATMIGLDAQWLDASPRYILYDTMSTASPSSSLKRVDMRLGQQVGAHLQLANAVALFADGTLDYDGQWRIRAGIAIGKPLR